MGCCSLTLSEGLGCASRRSRQAFGHECLQVLGPQTGQSTHLHTGEAALIDPFTDSRLATHK